MALMTRSRFVVAKTVSDSRLADTTVRTTVVQPTTVVKPTVLLHPAIFNTSAARKVFTPIIAIPITVNPPIPDVSTKNGNIFNDRFDKNLRWYLPSFNLVSNSDNVFSFIAKPDTLPSSTGDPFYVTDLKFTIQKEIPADVVTAKSADATISFKEITLESLQVTLFIAFKDANGNDAHTAYTGNIQQSSDGNYEVHVANIKGAHVVLLYENLRTYGGAQLALSATYSAWRPSGAPMMVFATRSLAQTAVKPAMAATANIKLLQVRTFPLEPRPTKPGSGFNENQTFYQVVDLNKKYAENEYQLNYKLDLATGLRPIIDVSDLKDLKGNPTEFSELRTIDVGKYPSIQSLYIGVLSKVIIIIPKTYCIVRNALTCSASCLALVDSTPSGANSCKFQFQFELTPAIDPVDFIELVKEVQQNTDLQPYTLKFADTLGSATSLLNSAFTSNASFDASATPQNFLVTTTIIDAPGQSAVASANLFIQNLCGNSNAFVPGTIFLKLDDNYPNPVSTTVMLSLPKAISDDGIGWSVDADAHTIKLTNSTAFNFLLQRYVLTSDEGIGEPVEINTTLNSGDSTTIPLPQNFEHLSIILDYIEQSNGVDRTNISSYMEIKAQDIQNISYTIGVSSTEVNYAAHNIKQINVQAVLDTLSTVNVPQFSLSILNKDNLTKIVMPLQFTIASLPATLNFSIEFLDPNKPQASLTKTNDFISNPIFDLKDEDVAAL